MTQIIDWQSAKQARTGQGEPGPRFQPGDRVVPVAHPGSPYYVVVAARPDPRYRYRYQTMLGGLNSQVFAEDDIQAYEPPGPRAA